MPRAVSSPDRSHPPLVDPATPHPSHNPGSWISHWARVAGKRTAVVFEQDKRAYTRTYESFEDDVAKVARLLLDRGVTPGDRVAILLDNHPAYLEAIFAGARIGAIILPINTRLAPAELGFILADAEPRWVFSDHRSDALLDRVPSDINGFAIDRLSVPRDPADWRSQLEATSPLRENLAVRPDDPMLLMYTSGTTGVPKGALLPFRKALYNSLNAEGCFAIRTDDRCLVVAPLFHSLGLHILSLPVFHAGARVVLQSGFDEGAVLDSIARHQITYMGGVPTHYERLLAYLQQSSRTYDLSSLRFLFGAGAAVSTHTIRAFAERGIVLKQGYGQTETSLLCCLDGDQALRKAGSVGRALEHLELRVVRQDSLAESVTDWQDIAASGEDQPGELGEIVVRGPITMLGYWRQEAATRETLREGWVLTGDLARIDREGFITLVGRSRELFISGGENVYPAEIETAYRQHPGILEIAVMGIPHEQWGEVGCAYVVMAEGQDCDPPALREWGRERLASYKIPHRFQALDSLPKTASGKVQKHRLG